MNNTTTHGRTKSAEEEKGGKEEEKKNGGSSSSSSNNNNFAGMIPNMDDTLKIYPDDASDSSSMISSSETLNLDVWDVSPRMNGNSHHHHHHHHHSNNSNNNNRNNNTNNNTTGMGRSSSYSSFETMSSYYTTPVGGVYPQEQFTNMAMKQQRISTPQPQRISETTFMTPSSPQPTHVPTIQVSYQPKMLTPQSPVPTMVQGQFGGHIPSEIFFHAPQPQQQQQQSQQKMNSPMMSTQTQQQQQQTKMRSSPVKSKSKPREHPLGEHPSRTLFVRNISSSVEDDELKNVFSKFGSIRNMYTACKHRGFVMITYFDIRHAKLAKHELQGFQMRRRDLDIHYSIPKENPSEKDMNQGTLVVFNLAPEVTNEEIRTIFGRHGQVKEVRETPNKAHHRFVEFYDSRDAEKALKSLNKREIHGKKIKIECSRPGGRSRVSNESSEKKRNKSPYRPHSNSNGGNIRYKIDLDLVRDGTDERTTLMIKNIPNKYSQRMLLELIDRLFAGCYNFFYLPIDFKNKCNVGYAFINLTDPRHIINFAEEFNGKKWHKFNSEKVCELTYGRVQGKMNLNDHFANSSLMCEDESCRPVFFDDSNIPPAKNQFPSESSSSSTSTTSPSETQTIKW
eukprot:CAMPEP_0117425370 /NCGR_PEP_ID=MMETSP0758-20121206/5636_1 /TAXON_ID=63605 /ORGANISM="Percolomonas cosmopolitus, Strain AE-1 (ATCC 50343)" /LENGTH=620 /DNA_ID=CAMNT_0005209775 /DNA_START=295 /DNA_END=2154 /DNA_ORIENTATION=-